MPNGLEKHRIVVAGGGVAALEAVLALDEAEGDRVSLTMITADARFTYAPLAVAQAFGLGRAFRVKYSELLEGLSASFEIGRLASVDRDAHVARLEDGSTRDFDALLLATGVPRVGVVPGAITFSAHHGAEELRQLTDARYASRLRRVVITVPPEVTWTLPGYEIALIASSLFEALPVAPEVFVVTPEERPLAAFGEEASRRIALALEAANVGVVHGVPIEFGGRELKIERQEGGAADLIDADAVIALPVPDPSPIPGVPHNRDGFIPVDDRARVQGVRGLYAAGDVTAFHLKQGGIAVQQADLAAQAILYDLGAGPEPEPFQPRLEALLLTGTTPVSRRAESTAWKGEQPAKVSGGRLARHLAHLGVPPGAPPGMLGIELAGG